MRSYRISFLNDELIIIHPPEPPCLSAVFWRGWTQEKISETIGLSQNHVSEIIGNTNFGNIDNLLSQGHDMDYIASHYRMDPGLARPASQGFSRWRNKETSFDELQAEIDAKGWLEARFLHQQG